ncbi:hypothetical protein VUR80DRAFT_2269 [Thermomyces stellatus]
MSDVASLRTFLRWENLDFASDCEAWGNWFATFILPNPWDPVESLDGSLGMTLQLMESAVSPLVLDLVATANVSQAEVAGEALGWWANQMYDTVVEADDGTIKINTESDFIKNVVTKPSEKCPEALCKAFGYSGNDDITGIGVHSSYYMQAALVTLYLLAFTIASLQDFFTRKNRLRVDQACLNEHYEDSLRSRTRQKLALRQRTLNAFRASLDAFLTTAMLMSIAMTSAAISLAVKGVEERRAPLWEQALPFGDSDVYNVALSVIAAGFSVFPVIVIYLLISRRDRGGVGMQEGLALPPLLSRSGRKTGSSVGHRAWIRQTAMFIIWVLITAEVFLSPRGNLDYDFRDDAAEDSSYNICNKRGGVRYWQSMKAAQWLVIGAPLLWMVITAFLVTGFGVPGLASSRLVRKVRSVWDLAVAWLNLLLAWGLLGYFTIFRNKIIDTAEEVDSGNEWGFGQILALATWMPVVLEFLYVLIWGIENRLQPQIYDGFQEERDVSRERPPTSAAWTELTLRPTETKCSSSRSAELVACPYEGAADTPQKPGWVESVEMSPLRDGRPAGETAGRRDGDDSDDSLGER